MHRSRQAPARLGVALSMLLAALFAVFIFAAAFNPALLAGSVLPGGTVSWWFAYGLGLIWATVLIIGLYVLQVNAWEARR